jgi:8-oxo-dGTP diphosphatase
VIDDYACRTVGGALRAGDDAGDTRFVSDDELGQLPLAPLLVETLREWGELG